MDSERDNIETCSSSQSSVTPILIFSTVVAVCGSFGFGFAVGYSSPAQSGIMEDLGLSVSEYSVFGSIMTIGGMVGAIFCGRTADIIGRKRTMWLSEIFCTPGWLAIAFAKDAWWLDIGRLLVGLGVGLITYVVPVYIAEIAPKNLRGRFTSANTLMISFGFALAYFSGNIISWRLMAIIAVVPCAMQIIGLFIISESPRWLAKIGREKEIEASLQLLRGRHADVSQETVDILDFIDTMEHNSPGRIMELFQKRYAHPLVVGVGLMLLQQLAGTSGLAYYASSVFAKADISVTMATTALAILQLPAATTALLLMDIFGRRTLLMASAGGTCLFFLLSGLSFYLQDLNSLENVAPILMFIGVMGGAATFAIGMSGIPWVIMSEIFPVNVKAQAGSLVTLTNWSCSWIVTYTFNFIMEWSSAGTFFIFGTVSGLTVLFVWKLVPETKGRTLEEIQATITLSPRRERLI